MQSFGLILAAGVFPLLIIQFVGILMGKVH
jgi:nitrate reductase NapE component